MRGQRGWVVDKVEDLSTADLVERLPVRLGEPVGLLARSHGETCLVLREFC